MKLHFVNLKFLSCKYPLKYSVCAYREFVLNGSNTVLTSDIKYCIVSVTSSRTCRRADVATSILRLYIVDSERININTIILLLISVLGQKQLNFEKKITQDILACLPLVQKHLFLEAIINLN